MHKINDIEDIRPVSISSVNNNPWKSVSIYAIFSLLWIAFSDQVLLFFADDIQTISNYQTYKGIFFVISTSLILYFFIRKDYARTVSLTNEVIQTNEEIVAYTEELHAMEDTLKRNIKELHLTNSMLASQNQYVDEIYNRSNAAILMWLPNGTVVDFNDQFRNLLEYDEDELAEMNWLTDLVPEFEQTNSNAKVKDLIQDARNENYERRLITKSGDILYFIWNDALIKNPANGKPLILSFGMDVTIQKEQEMRLEHLMTFDELTGLGNKVSFESTLKKHMDQHKKFAMYSIDFDNFRRLNEAHGFKTGDLFLSTFGRALYGTFKDFDCFRWSADEFYMIHAFEGSSSDHKLHQSILNFSSQKWTLGRLDYKPTVSIGVVEFPKHGTDPNTLLKNLNIALNYAKTNGRNQIVYFDEIQHEILDNTAQIAFELGRAIETGSFQLHYQPIYELKTQKMTGAEVLIRWPNSFNVNTGTFISIAENTGQIKSIDYWVIDTAFRFIADHRALWKDLTLSINLSAQSFNSHEIIDYLNTKLSFYKIDTSKVSFEITEYSIISNIEFTKQMIKELKQMGFKVSLDDFGTQYSSLNYLGKLSLDHLKIDKSYTDLITENSLDHIIVNHIVKLSTEIGLETIAEGIETESQLAALIDMGCHMGQGYLLNRPMPSDQLIRLIEEGHHEKMD